MKRPQVIMVAAAAIILGLLWCGITRQREPRYNGRSLTDWLELCQGSSVPPPEAADAVRHIGTNALPFLINWVDQYQFMPPWRHKLYKSVGQWGAGTPGKEVLMETIASRQRRAQRASSAFEILGETARDAAPDLEQIATRRDTASPSVAIAALPHLGRAGLYPLLSMITNTALPWQIRDKALTSVLRMGFRGTNAQPAAALLIRCLDDSQIHVEESEASVPGFIVWCTHSTNATLRKIAAASPGEFGGRARAAVPYLTKLLDDPEVSVRREATAALDLIRADPSAP